MEFKQNDKHNYLSDIKWPNWEYFSVLLQEDKTPTSELLDMLGGMVWIGERTTETALVYGLENGRIETKYAIKNWDMRDVLAKAKNFDDAVEIFFRAENKFNDWSNINSPEEYFEISKKIV